MEDVVATAVLARALQGDDIQGRFDDTDDRLPGGITAQAARVGLGGVETDGAERNPRLDVENRLGERRCLFGGCAEQMVGETGCRFRTNPRKAPEFVNETGDRLGGDG